MSKEKIEGIASIIAAEEIASDPSQSQNKNLKKEIIEVLNEERRKKDDTTSNILDLLTRSKNIMNEGGLKAIGMKFLMYFLLPLFTIIGVGFLGFSMFRKRRIFLTLIKGVNKSSVYKDKKTKWKLRVKELVPNISEDHDRENYEKVKAKMKEVYK